ncbi:MAG: anti-sigma factor antagonist [Candidatus Wallbacteria bacterium]|nr:anti-sigma factor antagonist [Candidatus Wallbacteria bacterium]
MDHELIIEGTNRILLLKEKAIDVNNIAEFRDLLEKHATEGTGNIILGLDDVDYMGSVALGMISLASIMVDKRAGKFVVVCGKDSILKLFIVSGLYRVIRIVETLDAARQHLDRR